MHHYHAFGLRIASELPLPELHSGSGPGEVEIRYRESARNDPDDDLPWFEGAGDDVLLRLQGIRFHVAAGRRIDIDAPLETPSADTRVWLLGSVMAALLHQRGFLPVHANVIALADGKAAAFAGDSGAGKSTLAAWFETRGQRVLADDLCAIRLDEAGIPRLFEGIPRVKLWSDALDAFGRAREGLEKVASDIDKYHVPLARSAEPGSLDPLTLERIYLLERATDGEDFGIFRMAGAEAANAVLVNAFRWELGQLIQPHRAQFDHCLALARHANVFRVRRRWGFDSFDTDCQAIEAHLQAPLAGLNVQ